jgi:hypothetical protein
MLCDVCCLQAVSSGRHVTYAACCIDSSRTLVLALSILLPQLAIYHGLNFDAMLAVCSSCSAHMLLYHYCVRCHSCAEHALTVAFDNVAASTPLHMQRLHGATDFGSLKVLPALLAWPSGLLQVEL